MASRNSTTPTVRIARPSGRPLVIWYRDSNGKKIRKSTGSYDEQEAERQRRQLEARLVLDLPATASGAIAGPSMSWAEFKHAYLVSVGKRHFSVKQGAIASPDPSKIA